MRRPVKCSFIILKNYKQFLTFRKPEDATMDGKFVRNKFAYFFSSFSSGIHT